MLGSGNLVWFWHPFATRDVVGCPMRAWRVGPPGGSAATVRTEEVATAVSEGKIGRVLNGRYRLSRSLGRGGMGEVWLAVDTALGREVAIKELLLPPSAEESAQRCWLERSKREASAAARIRHENVVTVHDVFEADGRPWIVMELVISHSLADAIRQQGRLDCADAARIGLYVLRALRAAHARGVLHRDVKPANVLLGLDGRVVLTDFGIATFAEAPQVTQHGELLGTPGYLAPERAQAFTDGQPFATQQAQAPSAPAPDLAAALEPTPSSAPGPDRRPSAGEPVEPATAGGPFDPASDLWSLGATLYEMVEGVAPFRRASPVEVVDAVVHHDPAPPRHAGALEPVVMGLLRKDPAQRLDAKETERLLARIVHESTPPTWAGERPAGPGAGGRGVAVPVGDSVERTVDGSVDQQREAGGGTAEDGVEETLAGEASPSVAGRRPRTPWRRRRVLVPTALVLALVAVGVPWLVWSKRSTHEASADGTSVAELESTSPTYRAMVQRGYMIVGVKPDQPGLSQRLGPQDYAGFDDEIARMIATDLGFANRVRYMDVETQGREYRISSGQVDLVVSSYTIDDDRLRKVSFAGPYLVAGQDFMVRRDDTAAVRPEDLSGDRVCVVRDSTSAARVRKSFPTMQVQERGLYSECVADLLTGAVRAVSTDDTILAGFVSLHPGQLRLLAHPFSEEPYGVGLSKGDTALATAVCHALNRHVANGDWQHAYDRTLAPLGLPSPRPPTCQVNVGE